ncbi:PAS domain S-box-containing protein/diguanylate cyclase (GGDEF) domain-containing protein [Parasphingorhabdus marina DSM 22363]|uniref:PAS domain S-box-containing protein/diguanylate cyclase (GGDEF) domain-containing protein n=1 Tax=Parasphingorhabdus marina DSM 22363 TaxID=1123272 RepID=A0A1N6CVF2_9SPHN|nr:GGDEF and EAL domain-containing protein [Parasphingorhabdus marina]SIN62374.1 PAS domain S-box-containing protein/diguanylate cyclase (GGDEF) domain-containing protein [Parasphingorhabdus marina DSM 22363]
MEEKVSQSGLPRDIPLRVLIGLADPEGVDWGRIRALQFEGVRQHDMVKIIGSTVCGALAVQIAAASVGWLAAGLWFVALCGLYFYSHLTFKKQALWQRKSIDLRDTTIAHLFSAAAGGIWGIGFVTLALFGDQAAMMNLWSIMICLMVGSAMMLSAIPLSSLLYIGISGGAMIFGWYHVGSFQMTLGSMAITVLLLSSCLMTGRSFIYRKVAEAHLNEKSEVVSLLLKEFEDTGADWLWQTDTSRRIAHVSPRFAHALGMTPEEIDGKPFLQLVAGQSWDTGKFPPALHDLAEKLKRRDSFSNMMVPVQIRGETRWWELSASPKLDDSGVFHGFRGVGSDVTEQRESADKISHMARFDTLTSLPNRLQLTETLGKAMQNSDKWNGRCGFMMIDLDRFKAVNDTLGHPVGDRLLARVADRLRSIMTDNELCGRLGGDEFAIVIRDASDSQYTEMLGKKIIETLSRPYEVDQHTLYIGASVGTAIGPRDGRTVEMLMRSADLALYRSKDQGGGAHNQYEPKLHVHAEERRVMEIALRKALDNEEFSLNYQPVVSADTGGVMGFEALLRWTNPEFGVVSPAKFIPLAEDARLIVPIGEWVMRTACKEAMNWPSTVKVAVNVSADQLSDPNFLDMVVSALQDSQLPAQRLEIEVTESIFMREGTGATEVLDQIIALGINLSLDDFGTGYSSLGYLRKTRFTTIKVDRSFVQGAAKKVPESLAIIRAVVAMADSLGMSTTAEGAETEEEVKMIQKLGCRKIQGYYFGRPMAPHDALDLFRNFDPDAVSQDDRAA